MKSAAIKFQCLRAGARFRATVLRSVAAFLAAGVPVAASGADTNALATAPERWAASVRWENDTFGGADRFYTDGFSLGVSHTGANWLDPLADWLPWGEGRRTITYELTQAMFTPDDTDLSVLDPDDRPYAGILTFSLSLHVEKERSYHGLKFSGGVVGSLSLAEETQDLVHEIIDTDKAQGWDHQLENEPIFNLSYEYRRKYRIAGQRERWSAEAIPLGGGWLGNALTQGQAGGIIRAGYNMPNDFGPTLVRGMSHMPPPRREESGAENSDWGFSIYGGSVGHVVVRDVTLDGNSFEDSPSVDKKWFLPMGGVGFTLGTQRFQASFAYVFWGKEFDDQAGHSEFGALTLAYFF